MFTAVVKLPSNQLASDEDDEEMVRLTISLPKSLYGEVQNLAKRDDRSLAFVIRKAVEQRVHEEQPLLYPKSV